MPYLRIVLSISVIALSGLVFAHHSFAMFDDSKNVEVAGEVKEFQWTNPHAWIQLNVADASGQVTEWGIEIPGGPNNLKRHGWTRETLKPGDKIKVMIHPLKTGSGGGSFVSLTLADGSTMNM